MAKDFTFNRVNFYFTDEKVKNEKKILKFDPPETVRFAMRNRGTIVNLKTV